MNEPRRARTARPGPRHVMLGLVEVAGYYAGLERALNESGVRATLVDLTDHPFRYSPRRGPLLVRAARAAIRRRHAVSPSGRLRRLAWWGAEALLRVVLFGWALVRFDAFVFGFGSSFLGRPAFELRILRSLGKRVVHVFHGSDSRPPYLDGSVMASERAHTLHDCARMTRATKARVRAIDRLSHHVVQNPLTAHFHERPCVHWHVVGIPQEPRGSEHEMPPVPGSSVRVLHSPSHPEVKGSARIRAAIESLRARGHAIEFVEITGRPNAEVLRELARCDFVVDQLYSDTPMAGFATEAAHCGRPAVVAGYGGEEFRRLLPADAMPPVEFCHPDNIELAIERLVTDRAYRLELGRRAQDFVRSRWAPSAVAQRYLRILQNDVPAEWTFEPAELLYVHGCGLPEERARAYVSGLVAADGRAALCVSDKPELERRLLALASDRRPDATADGASTLQQAGS